jgi:threonine dehydratase
VVAFSSGNHAQAVAGAAKHFGVPAVIVMPADAPRFKIEATKSHGAEIVLYDRIKDDREAIGRAISEERGLTLVKPFDDPDIIAGQGTVGLEIAEEVEKLDAALICTSGGGLTAGCAIALKARFPHCAVYGVEPAEHDDFARSLKAGARVKNAPGVRSICDALMSEQVGEYPFALAKAHDIQAVSVSDDEVRAAMRFAAMELKLVVEPGGAVGLAALMAGRIAAQGKRIGVVLSGGNVDAEMMREVLP